MSSSLQTMGFFMSEINFCNTKEQLNHLGEVVTGKTNGSPAGSDINTSTLAYTGQVRKTLPALEAEYIQAIRGAGGDALNGGVWTSGQTFTAYNQYMVYNGIAYKPLTTTTLPYGPTGSAPDFSFVGPFENSNDSDPSNPNIIANHDFSVAGSVSNPPDATPRNYIADDELFQGFKAVSSLAGVTYINGVLGGSGQLYADVKKTDKLEQSTSGLIASVASPNGEPVTSSVSLVDNGSTYRVTFDINSVFSVKLEQGAKATNHSVDYGFVTEGSQTPRTQSSRASDSLNVRDFGIPTGGDDTAAIQYVFDISRDRQRVIFNEDTYNITKVVLGKPFNIEATGAKFNITGSDGGFHGIGDYVFGRVSGGEYIGDGIDYPLIQTGFTISVLTGDDIEDLIIEGAVFRNLNIGMKIAYGESPFEPTFDVNINKCKMYDMHGTAAGRGYGMALSQAHRAIITDCIVVNVPRHGIYVSEGTDAVVANCQVSQCGLGGGSLRGAINIDRTQIATLTGCIITGNDDVGFLISEDGQGEVPYNDSRYVTISGNTFVNNSYGSIKVGIETPDGLVPDFVTITGNTFKGHPTLATTEMYIWAGRNINVFSNTFWTQGANKAIDIREYGANQTDNITIKANSFNTSNEAIEIESDICTGTQSINITDNSFTVDEPYRFLGGEDSITNPNLIYKRNNGQCIRSYTGSSSTLPVAGVDVMRMESGAPHTITSLAGIKQGDVITFVGVNGSATFAASYFYNDIGGDIVLGASDTVTYVIAHNLRPYLISKSANV